MRHLRQRAFSLKDPLKRSFRVNPAALMFASMVTVLALYGFRVALFELIELKTYDLRFVSRGRGGRAERNQNLRSRCLPRCEEPYR
jgi:hypothetical protein